MAHPAKDAQEEAVADVDDLSTLTHRMPMRQRTTPMDLEPIRTPKMKMDGETAAVGVAFVVRAQ
jgi:hypothetical protein